MELRLGATSGKKGPEMPPILFLKGPHPSIRISSENVDLNTQQIANVKADENYSQD